jgi:hypothetical protein
VFIIIALARVVGTSWRGGDPEAETRTSRADRVCAGLLLLGFCGHTGCGRVGSRGVPRLSEPLSPRGRGWGAALSGGAVRGLSMTALRALPLTARRTARVLSHKGRAETDTLERILRMIATRRRLTGGGVDREPDRAQAGETIRSMRKPRRR